MSRFRAHSAWVPAGDRRRARRDHVGDRRLRWRWQDSSSDNGTAQKSVGAGEGELNLVAWPGYVADPWKSDFEKQTGCQVKRQGGRHLG